MSDSWIEGEIALNWQRMRTKWISDSVYRNITPEIRRQVREALGHPFQLQYASNIENALRDRGEHRLAQEFLEDLVLLPYPLRNR